MYNIQGARSARTGLPLVTAQPFELRGIKRYEEFEDVFFLDKIERVAKGRGDALEIGKLKRFREMQLKARDGALDRADHEHMKSHMSLENMPDERKARFFDPDVYCLVTTRAKRDSANMAATTALIDKGAPGMCIKAVHNPPASAAALADDDEVGLSNELVLVRGSRVMVSWNISVAHGLVNGTVGNVVDILVQKGIPTAVLVAVRRATKSQPGYSGPSFTSPANYDLDVNENAIVAIGRKTVKVHVNKTDSTRSQFPLMLAHAVTVHKAQGLTLSRVRIDAGDDERSVGLLFVALTRTRHPDHIAFDPMPDLARVTSVIATKPALRKRKMHERQLREKAAQTKVKYASCAPPVDEATQPDHGVSEPDVTGPGSGSDDSEASDFDSDADDPGGSHGAGSVGDGDQREREARLAELHRQEAQLRELSLTRNQDALEALQVPPFEARLTPLPPPPWLSRILVKIRIVDFWHPDLPRQRGCGTSRLFVQYLRHLGLDVVFTNHMTQIGCACGWVAARCSTDMAVAQDWKTCGVSRAVAQHWITVGNAILGTPGDESHFIGNEHVIELTNAFWNADCGERHEEPGPPCARCGEAHLSANCHKLSHPRLHDANDRHLGWLKTVTASDHALRLLMEDLHKVTTTGASIQFRSIISNNQDSRSGGSHWFTIAFSAEFGGNDERASADHNPQPADAKDGGDEEFEYVYSDGEISGDDVEMDISGPVAPRKLE